MIADPGREVEVAAVLGKPAMGAFGEVDLVGNDVRLLEAKGSIYAFSGCHGDLFYPGRPLTFAKTGGYPSAGAVRPESSFLAAIRAAFLPDSSIPPNIGPMRGVPKNCAHAIPVIINPG